MREKYLHHDIMETRIRKNDDIPKKQKLRFEDSENFRKDADADASADIVGIKSIKWAKKHFNIVARRPL